MTALPPPPRRVPPLQILFPPREPVKQALRGEAGEDGRQEMAEQASGHYPADGQYTLMSPRADRGRRVQVSCVIQELPASLKDSGTKWEPRTGVFRAKNQQSGRTQLLGPPGRLAIFSLCLGSSDPPDPQAESSQHRRKIRSSWAPGLATPSSPAPHYSTLVGSTGLMTGSSRCDGYSALW